MLLYRVTRKFYSLFPSLFRPYTMQAKVAGEQFSFYIRTFEGSHWYGKHRDQLVGNNDQELACIKQFISPGEIFADVGAHHGYYTLLFSRCVGKNGKVYAFECLPANYAILTKNIALNGVLNVFVEHYAVGAQEGHIAIANDSSGVVIAPLKKRILKVPLVSLDAFFAKESSLPTMLKIDVEGYEWQVLQGCMQILQSKPKVILEIHNFVHKNPYPLIEKGCEMFKDYKNVLWQESPYSQISKFTFSKASLSNLAHQSNPRLFLIP